MKQLLDFLNESKGQRISLRGENKPYSPNTDILVQKRDSRKSRAEKLRNDRWYAKVSSDFEKFKQALKNIYNAKNEILSDNYIHNIKLMLYDIHEKNYYNIYISEPKKLGNIEILNNKYIDIDKLCCIQNSNMFSRYARLAYNNDLDSSWKYSIDNSESGDNGKYSISIKNEDFFDKNLFIYIDCNWNKKDNNGKLIDTQRFVSSLIKRITKRNSYGDEGYVISAKTLMDNPDLFMKAYEEIKERF